MMNHLRRVSVLTALLSLVAAGCSGGDESTAIACLSSADCPANAICAANGACVLASSDGTGALLCTSDADCPSYGVCDASFGLCVPGTNSGSVDSGTDPTLGNGQTPGGSTGGICNGVECPNGQFCSPFTGMCQDNCEGVVCPAGTVCDDTTGGCIAEDAGAGTGTIPGTGSGTTGPPPAGCDYAGFNVAQSQVTQPQAGVVVWGGFTAEQAPYDTLQVQLYQGGSFGGATAPGEYNLNGTNYADCGNCVRIDTGCNGQTCTKTFYGDVGTLEVTQLDASTFSGILKGVELKEVTIDPQTYTSTPVAGGEVWCLDNVSFTADFPNTGGTTDPGSAGSNGLPVATEPAEATCVEGGNGFWVGNNIAELKLKNCLGEEVSLHAGCGTKKAIWMIGTAGW